MSHGPGTLYRCGCWHGGNPAYHPHTCPTHGEVWGRRFDVPKKLDLDPIKKDWEVTKQGEQK